MKINNLLILAVFIFSISTNVVAAQRKQKVVSNREDRPLSLGVTHILPSAFVIPGGTLILGTTAGFGLFDFMDVTTNLYLDFQSVFNVRSKVNLLKDEDYALGISVGYITQTVKTYDATGLVSTSQTSSSVTPGLVFSYRIFQSLIGHIGSTIVFRTPVIDKSKLVYPKSGYLQGNTLNKEFALGLTSDLALAFGGSYDVTYDYFGAGASLHVGGFQIGAHYYFNVSEGSVLPILGGGYSASF